MRSLLFVALFASVASAGTPIINGTADAADPAVVEIYAYPSTKDTLYTCTGIVIAPNAILTAAHCLDHTGYTFGVYYGADANTYNGQISQVEPFLKFATSVTIHPDYDRSSPFTADIGVMIMADTTTVTPLAFSRTAPTAALVNAPVRIVGYGETTSGTFNNARYQADTIVAGLDGSGDDTILVGDTHYTCIGDSGGPVLQNNVVLGVDSYGPAGCTGPAHYRRTDVYASFIDSVAGTGSGSGSGSGSASGSGSDTGSGSDMTPTKGDSGGCSTTSGSGAGLLIGLFAFVRRRANRR